MYLFIVIFHLLDSMLPKRLEKATKVYEACEEELRILLSSTEVDGKILVVFYWKS